jgi:hypothetical protein
MRAKCPMPMRFLVTLLFCSVSPSLVFPQTPFFQGKTIKIINNDPTGTAGLRVKGVMPFLRKYIPGNPTVVIEFMEGGGGRRAANYLFQNTTLRLIFE